VAEPNDLRRIYPRIIGSRIRSQLTYRTSFALDVLAQFLGQSTELVAILVLFTQVTALGGFSAAEVLLIYGLAATAFGLADLAVGQVEELPNFIRTGEFDVMLLRPLGTLPQLLSADISLKRIGRVASGLLVLGWSVATLDLHWTPARVLLAVTTPITGALILSAIWVAANSVSFWIVDGREMANSFTYGSNFSTAYPINIYGPWLRRALCYAVPAAFVAYFPALGLLGKADPLGLPAALQWSSPVVAVVAVAVAGSIWRSGVRHYQGAGS
jgi:ABC-2 type transport system permease protein